MEVSKLTWVISREFWDIHDYLISMTSTDEVLIASTYNLKSNGTGNTSISHDTDKCWGWSGFFYLFNDMSTLCGFFNAKILFISKWLITIITLFSMSNCIFMVLFHLSIILHWTQWYDWRYLYRILITYTQLYNFKWLHFFWLTVIWLQVTNNSL